MPEGKAWERLVPNWDVNAISQEAEMQLVVLGGDQIRRLTSGMTALVFGHSVEWRAEPTKELQLWTKTSVLAPTGSGTSCGGGGAVWARKVLQSACPLAMTK